MIRMSKLPLEGVRIIDCSSLLAGPYACAVLGDMGAEVIKIEGPSRPDFTRGSAFAEMFPDNQAGPDFWNRTGTYNGVNRGKKSLVLDLSREEGREVLVDLVKVSDVLIENFTPRVMRGWGLDYPNLKAINSGIVMVSNTGYGHGGPYSSYPAQATTQEATHGLAAVTGYRGDKPSKAGQSYVDFLAWWACTAAALLGLRYRRRFGSGLWADVGMYQLGCFNVSEYVLNSIANGIPGDRIGNRHRQYAPQGCYRCAGDDAWCVLCVRDDEDWAALCRVIGRPEMASDLRYATESARRVSHDEIDSIISGWTKAVTKIDAMQRLQAAGVPAGAVLDGRDLHLDPHLKSRGLFETVEYPRERDMGSKRVLLGRPWRFGRIPAHVRGPAPAFGQHNREILTNILAYDDGRCAALENDGIVAAQPVKPRPILEMEMDKRVELGYLAYWDPDFRKHLGYD